MELGRLSTKGRDLSLKESRTCVACKPEKVESEKVQRVEEMIEGSRGEKRD